MEYKNISLDCVKLEEKKDSYIISGYISTFNHLDSYKDTILKNAFTESLGKRTPKVLSNHIYSEVIGVCKNIFEDEYGLFAETKLIKEVQKSRETFHLLKEKGLDGLSIGFNVLDHQIEKNKDGEFVKRILEKIDLFEYSVVTFQADTFAKVTNVKGIEEIETIRDCEEFLKKLGISNSESKKIISKIKFLNNSEGRDDLSFRDENEEELIKNKLEFVKKLNTILS